MMLMLLMRDGKADTGGGEQFDMLTGLLGLEEFRKVFQVILTDNGSEFKHTRDMETTEDSLRFSFSHKNGSHQLTPRKKRSYSIL